MYSYLELEAIKQDLVRQGSALAAESKQLETAWESLEARTAALSQQYQEFHTEVTDFAQANPDDPAVAALKAAVDRIVTDVGNIKTKATDRKGTLSAGK